jgi:superfamily II DNA or RNA helicase
MKVQIAVGKTCRILNLEQFDKFDILYKKFSVQDPSRFYNFKFRAGIWDGMHHYVWSDGRFPIGLLRDVIIVTKKLGYGVKLVPTKDIRLNTKPKFEPALFNTDGKLRLCQINAVKIMDKSQVPVGSIVLTTGGGKTEIMMSYVQATPEGRYLYLCRRKLLAQQTKRRMEKFLGEEVGILTGTEKNIPSNVRVVCAVDRSLIMAIKKKQFKPSDFDGIFYDECHTHSKDVRTIIRYFRWSFVFGFTGSYPTLGRNPLKYWKIRSLIGPKLINITDEMVRNDETQTWMPNVTVYRIKNTIEKESGIRGSQIYETYIKYNDERNKLIAQLCKRLTYALVVVNHTAHGIELLKLCQKAKVNVALIHSKSRSDQAILALDNGDIDVLIATPVIDEGISINNIRHIIYAAGQKSETQVIQRVGRGKRAKDVGENKLYVWDFADRGIESMEKSSDQRFSVYKEISHRQLNVSIDKILSLKRTSPS